MDKDGWEGEGRNSREKNRTGERRKEESGIEAETGRRDRD
jgi:hypothetical protein